MVRRALQLRQSRNWNSHSRRLEFESFHGEGTVMLLFLGSGVSLASGLPSVLDVTDRVLNGTHRNYSKDSGSHHSEEGRDRKQPGTVREAQQLLRLLLELDEHYLRTIAPYFTGTVYRNTGSAFRAGTSYEDLFHLSEQIRLCGIGLTDDAQTGSFVDLVERRAGNVLKGETRDERLIYLYHLAQRASRLIERVVAGELHTDRVIGLDLVIELARSDEFGRLDIITLNHDTLVEQLLTGNDLAFVDGFGSHDGSVRWYDASLFDAKDEKVRIIKPHGSVNWYSFLVDGRQRLAIVEDRDPAHSQNEEGEELQCYSKEPSFLSGVNKVLAYNKGVYSEMSYRFHQMLREHQFMVMSGYGWGDTGINFRLVNWLDNSRQNTILLLHKEPDSLAGNSLQLAESYSGFVKRKQILPGNRWLLRNVVR